MIGFHAFGILDVVGLNTTLNISKPNYKANGTSLDKKVDIKH